MATTITTLTENLPASLPQKKGDPPNFGTVKSGRALAFDGVVDTLLNEGSYSYLNLSEDFTYVAWIKATSLSDACIINYGDDSSNRSGIVLSSGGKLGFTTYNGDSYVHAATPSENNISINQWHRVVATCNNNTLKFYLDGVEQTNTSQVFTSALASMLYDKFTIGARSEVNKFFAGYISDVQVWSAVWSLTDVQNDYRHPEMLAHTFSSTSLTESNLKLWYPMSEGNPESPQTTIFDGSPKGLGSEILANPNFDTDSDWAKSGGAAITGGYGFLDDSPASSLKQTSILTVGKVYYYTVVAKSADGGGTLKISDDGSTHVTESNVPTTYTTYAGYFTAVNTSFSMSEASSGDIYIDSASCKEVQRGNHATSVFYGDELINVGGNATNNRTFAGAGDWTAYNGAGIDVNSSVSGKMEITTTTDDEEEGIVLANNKLGALTVGKTYRVSAKLEYISGTHTTPQTKFYLGGGSSGNFDIDGTETTYEKDIVVSNASSDLFVINTSQEDEVCVFTVDDVSVKEVGLSDQSTAMGQETIFQPAFVGQNRMIAFDGDTYVGLGTIDTFKNKSAISLSFWICPNSYNSHSKIAAFSQDEVIECIIQEFDVPMLKLYINNNGVDFNKTLPLNEWTHVVMTFTGKGGGTNDTRKLYLNGSLSVTNDDTGTQADTSDYSGVHAIIGGRNDTYEMDGFINEVCVWDKALSLSEVQELYNDGVALNATTHSASPSTGTDNLIGYWRNNKLTSTGTWEDLSQNDNHGTLSGGSTVISPEGTTSGRDINGFFLTHPNKNYLSLDGTDGSYVNVPHSDVFNFGTGSFTVQFWVKANSLASDDRMVCKGTTDAGEWMVSIGSTDKIRVYGRTNDSGTTDSADFISTTQLLINTWAMITVIFNRTSDKIQVYKDDGSVNETTANWESDGAFDNTEPLTIGINDSLTSGQYFDGMIDDVRIYNRILTTDEIAKNYRHGKAKHKD
ncbi:MAG: putative concanavalin A-like lectin/glucanases superfamily protein [Prokaryotic dsDNA virus sp.]|nr:MAG: putative concanavalin A-like lectin/glucanases superfamily protein [Prokaryotic dsDNA virus sp.]|tara:strand:- start:2477 stop:5374 length:2898 start_codon:yes stop_codon:yes gene_type:complete